MSNQEQKPAEQPEAERVQMQAKRLALSYRLPIATARTVARLAYGEAA